MTLATADAPRTRRQSAALTLGIMQPYFFPYLGYFDLIRRSDRWIVFDVVQYRQRSWMNRNRVLHPTSGWQYVSVPVRRGGRCTLIRDVRLLDRESASRRILGQIEHYRRDAPFHGPVARLVREAFRRATRDTLVELNVQGLIAVCDYLGIPFRFDVASELDLPLPEVRHPGQWAVEICAALGATDYVNPAGGQELFRPHEFAGKGVRLHLAEAPDRRYACGAREFIGGLSIIDVLMWNAPSTVRDWLEERERQHGDT